MIILRQKSFTKLKEVKKLSNIMIVKRKLYSEKKKALWVESPDGKRMRFGNLNNPERLEKIKEKFKRSLIKSGSKYSIDQYKFYFE